jgi:hypothetical protein
MNVGIHGIQKKFLDQAGLRYIFGTVCEDMIRRKKSTEEFSLWGTYINEHRQDFLDSEIDPQFHELFNEVYQEVSAAQQVLV